MKKKKSSSKVAVSSCCHSKAMWIESMPPSIEIHECLVCGKACDVVWVEEGKGKESVK